MNKEMFKKFDEIEIKYFERFGTNYPLIVTDTRPLSEHIKLMEQAIKSGIPVTRRLPEGRDY